MKSIQLEKNEISVLKDLNNNLDKVNILKKLENIGFIKGIKTDYMGKYFIKCQITEKGQYFLDYEAKPFYQKIDYKTIGLILFKFITILGITIGAYFNILTFYFK